MSSPRRQADIFDTQRPEPDLKARSVRGATITVAVIAGAVTTGGKDVLLGYLSPWALVGSGLLMFAVVYGTIVFDALGRAGHYLSVFAALRSNGHHRPFVGPEHNKQAASTRTHEYTQCKI
jgi:hypothetical protein